MESNHYEMKPFFRTASFSLDITHYADNMVIHCFYAPLNFVPKYFQTALIEIVQICPDRAAKRDIRSFKRFLKKKILVPRNRNQEKKIVMASLRCHDDSDVNKT